METRLIKLTKGKSAIVDAVDYEYLNQWKWNFDGNYARRNDHGEYILMHRLINKTPKGLDTDHINQIKLDNRRSNLRTVTHQMNIANRNKFKNNTSGYIGVTHDKTTTNVFKKWASRIRINGKLIYLGRFINPKEAALAYNQAAKQYFGEYAILNLIGGGN